MSRPPVAFYCVCEERYFLGAVGMVNSLRLQGHDEPVYLLDCGLAPDQRELLEEHVIVVPGPTDAGPHLLKTIAPLRHPAETMILIDVDMIVTRPLTELVERAGRGHIVAFRNNMDDRFFPEWEELLDLGPIPRRPYLSSGFVILSGEEGTQVLRLLDDRQRRVDFDLTYVRANAPDYPFLLLEQDVLNPILASRVDPERIVALDARLAPDPPFLGVRLQDERTLRCAHRDGAEPYLLHFLAIPKPWIEPMYRDLYSRLLARLLTGDDVAIQVPPDQVPYRMRPGLGPWIERTRVGLRDRLGWYLRERLPEGLIARIDARRLRRGG